MINILIREFAPKQTVVDQDALEQFQKQWSTYQKLVEADALSHRAAGNVLHDALCATATTFALVDIACGDAGASVEALRGTQAIAYRGIDFSEPALQLAERAVERLSCPATLEQSDFLESVGQKPRSADVIWIGLSLHHLRMAEKRAFMRKVRGDLADGGAFLIYENASPDSEDREGWMRRWDLQRPLWTAYSDEEFAAMTSHVHSADFPETDASWRSLGMDGGFSSVRELYAAPSNLFRLYCFAA